MREQKAAQRHDDGEPTGVWDYVRISNGRGKPLGYCAGDPPTTTDEIDERWGANSPGEQYEHGWADPRARTYWEMIGRNRMMPDEHFEKHHDDGHDTKAEAEECYAEYIWDRLTTLRDAEDLHATTIDEVKGTKQTFECEADDCEEVLLGPTVDVDVYMSIGYHYCPAHQTEERVREDLLSMAQGVTWQS